MLQNGNPWQGAIKAYDTRAPEAYPAVLFEEGSPSSLGGRKKKRDCVVNDNAFAHTKLKTNAALHFIAIRDA